MLLNNARRDFDLLLQYCRETCIDGQPLAKRPLIRNRLAQLAIDIEVGRNLALRLTWMAVNGMPIVAEASAMRAFGGNLVQRLSNLGMQILGLYGQLDEQSKWAKLRGRMKYLYLASVAMTIEGGTTEASKSTVAGVGLGLPRG